MMLPDGCNPACPGCAHGRLTAAQSAAQKQAFLADRLAPWADRLEPLISAADEQRLGYRDRATLHAAWADAGWLLGMLRRDEVIPIHDCPVHTPRLRAAVQLLAANMPPAAQFPLAFVVISGGQCTLVLKTARPPALDWLDDALQAQLADIGLDGLWLHLHPSAGKKIFHKRDWLLAWGRGESRDAQGLLHGPSGFAQLIPALYEASRSAAEDWLQPQSGDAVIDLYCGAGGTLRRWLASGVQSIGVELGGEAVGYAQRNAPDASVLRGCCATRLPQLDDWLAERGGACRLVYANPPRTGLEPEVTDWLVERCQPQRLAMLSCSAGTLARDLVKLEAGGYRVERLMGYDFFPRTLHVEVLALLVR
jgi:tRNA/tmRNA/rRNA uracil-C5-methylase (TrmA/RlmC/RlmD family)